MANTLYYGDNLEVLREHLADASVDLIYLDPPFNSNASYNVLFRAPSGAARMRVSKRSTTPGCGARRPWTHWLTSVRPVTTSCGR